MDIKLLYVVDWEPRNPARLAVIAADQEILTVLNGMGKIIVGGIAPVAQADCLGVQRAAENVRHLAEGAEFIAFSAWLDE